MTEPRRAFRCLLLLASTSIAAGAGTVPGTKLPSYQNGGTLAKSSWEIDGFPGDVGIRDLLWDPVGQRMLAFGFTESAAGDDKLLVLALEEDGSPDLSFGVSGVRAFDAGGNPSTEQALAGTVDPATGNIFMAGWTDSFGGDPELLVAALTPAGVPLTSFSASGLRDFRVDLPGPGGWDYARALVPDGNGGVYVAGDAEGFGGAPDRDLVVLHVLANGSVDTGWGLPNLSFPGLQVFDLAVGGGSQDSVSAMVRLPDGKLLIAGTVMTGSSPFTWDFFLLRLTATGFIDSSFGISGLACIDFSDASTSIACNGTDSSIDRLATLAVMADGRIVVAGFTQSLTGGTNGSDLAVARLLPGGGFDSAFAPAAPLGRRSIGLDFGGLNHDEVLAMTVQGDGKVVLAGAARFSDDGNGEDDEYVWMRLLANGDNDLGFGVFGVGWEIWDEGGTENDRAYALALDPDGRLLLGGDVEGSAGVVGDYAGFVKLDNDYVFADGFESGNLAAWSSSVP